MRNPLEIIRGLLRLGTLGALAGGGFLAALAAVVQLIADGTIVPEVVAGVFVAGSGIGFAVTTMYGAVLAATSRVRRVTNLSFWHAAAISGILGAVLPPAIVAIGGDPGLLGGMPPIAISALMGAALGGGLVAIAKSSDDGRIGSSSAEPTSIAAGPPATDEGVHSDTMDEEMR